MMRRRLVLLLSVLAFVPSVASAAPKRAKHANEVRSDTSWVKDDASDESKATSGGAVLLTLLADLDSLNPYMSTYADVDDVLRMIFPTLMHENPDYAKGP